MIVKTPFKAVSLVWLITRLSALSFFIFAGWSVLGPQPWARWSGFITILLLAIFFIVLPLEPQTNLPHYNLENDAQRGGALIARFIKFVLMIFWAYRFAFGKKSKIFFGRQIEIDVVNGQTNRQ